MSEGYDRNKDKTLFKEAVHAEEKRYLNVEVYSYDGGAIKARIKPVSKNTNPNADSNKQWINQKAITGMTKAEVKDVIIALEKAITKM